jgi:hypothetical protein
MKVFTLIFIFFPHIFGISYERAEDVLIQLYRETKRVYLQNPKNTSYYSPFGEMRRKLTELLRGSLQIEPIILFDILNQNVDLQMAHFFFGDIISIESQYFDQFSDDSEDWRYKDVWEEHLDPSSKSVKSFFEISKELMRIVCSRYDSETIKAIMPIILSIQSRYLHHLKESEDKMEAARWINEFELIVQTFDPGNIDVLLNLYKKLGKLAVKHKGKIKEAGEDKFLVLRLLTLFHIYCRQFYSNHWELLDGYKFTAIPLELLTFIILDFSQEWIFNLLRRPPFLDKCLLIDFFEKNNQEFSLIFKIFENNLNIEFSSMRFFFEDDPPVAKFMRESMGANPNPQLSEKQLWLIKCFFHIIRKYQN